MTTYRKKLIEVALPLDAINKESAREKSIRHGHPSTLHLWWARRPLAACRAVLFSSLVNDPGDDPMYSIDPEIEATERAKLFDLIEELVKWENSNNPRVINAARLEIARSIAANKVADKELKDDTPLVANAPSLPEEQAKYLPKPPKEYTAHDIRWKMPSLAPEQVNHFLAHYAPPALDPFAGGGSIPLEAQRLGLRAYASDLNPVPVLINKALVEIPSKFAGMPPVNPKAQKGKLKTKVWHGAEGLADDVRYYGQWMRDEAEKRIGHLYPKVKVTEDMASDRPDLKPYVGEELTVIAWLWARTVESPNPAARGAHVPLVRSFWLHRRKGKERFVQPIVDSANNTFSFVVKAGLPSSNTLDLVNDGTKLSRGCNFKCLLSDQPIPEQHVKDQGMAGKLRERLMAIVVQGRRERVYLSPLPQHEDVANVPRLTDLGSIEAPIAPDKRALWCLLYGIDTFDKLFTNRQLMALTTLSDLVSDVRVMLRHQAGTDNGDYADAVATYLGEASSKTTAFHCMLSAWRTDVGKSARAFGRQAIPMVWDFAEVNPFIDAGGAFDELFDSAEKTIAALPASAVATVYQQDATEIATPESVAVSTDPPYYDNVGYSDLSDFYYVWLRRSLSRVYPEVFSTLVTPKANELIASPYRHGGDKDSAKDFFEHGLTKTIQRIHQICIAGVPITIYYAFKQAENDDEDATASTGWETFLEAVIRSGLAITGTWPMRTESVVGLKTVVNALASSIVLVCRPRSDDASLVTRRDFANVLRKELPDAILHLQSGNVAPVDLAQASIGPGMAVFSRYQQVVNADGSSMSVREALQMINQVLDESLSEQEADFDSETRFAVRWFDQYGENDGPFGDAETLAKAMAVAVSGVVEAGIIASKGGKVRLLKRDQLDANWNPATDKRATIWECTQHLIRRLEEDGESAAAQLLAGIQQAKGSEAGEVARELSYRLYSTCERKSRAAEARSYNGLVVSWPEISRMARDLKRRPSRETQGEFFE